MVKFLSLICMLTGLSAFAGTEARVNMEEFGLNHFSASQAQRYQLGSALAKHRPIYAKCIYNFAVQGGSSTANITLQDEFGSACVIPKNAIIKDVLIDVLTPGAGASATMALTAQTAGDLRAALLSTQWATGITTGIPFGGTAGSWIKMTADNTVLATIAVKNFTAGKFNVLITYEMSQ